MAESNTEHSVTGEAPSGFASPEPTPSSTRAFIGFVPVSESVATESESAAPPSEDLQDASPQPQPTLPVTTLPICKINLREGCYRITFQPKTGTSIFHGTMRVEKDGSKTTISGDLYRFLTPAVGLPPSIAAPASVAIRPTASTIFAHPLTIPIYARNKYHSYLKVTDIKMPPLFSLKCAFTLTAQEYVYTQPPPGQFNGTFPPAPGTRTVKIVLSKATPPPGYQSVYFEGKLFEGATEKGSFKMGWVSSFFRRATLEIDTLQGAVAPQPVPSITGSGNEDFKTVFKTAGWNLSVSYDQVSVPVPAGVTPNICWSHANLHNLMANVRKPTTDLDKEWRFHLIVVPAAMGCSRGVMYDTIGVPREGAASFSDDGYPSSHSSFFGAAENQMQRNVPRAYLRSASHEVGHGFNQIHQEQEHGADNSIMTTTPSVADVLGDAASGDPGIFPDNINLGFNEHVRHHLIHFPDPAVRPGGMTFGSGHSSTVPQADQDRHYFSPDDLELTVRAGQSRIELGEPLLLTWELVNKSSDPIPTPTDIRTEAQTAFITVINPNGVPKPVPSFIIECEASRIENLAPEERLTAESRVYWGSRGFAFERAGRHIIEVHVMWSIAGVPFGVTSRTDVWVNFPQSDTDNDAAATLLHPEVGMYVALGGGANHLTEAVSRLNAAFSSNGTSDAAGGAAPKAMRGYDGLLPGDNGGRRTGDRSDADAGGRAKRTASKPAATSRAGAGKSRKSSKKK